MICLLNQSGGPSPERISLRRCCQPPAAVLEPLPVAHTAGYGKQPTDQNRTQDQPNGEGPAQAGQIVGVEILELQASRPRPQQQRSQLIAKPKQRQVGDGVADPGACHRQELVAAHGAGQSQAHQHL